MSKRPLFIAFAGVGVLLGCSKDLKHTNKIHGTWDIARIETVSTTGTIVSSIDPDGVMQFDKCDVRPDDFRAYRHDFSYHSGDSVIIDRGVGIYKFDDQGRQLVVRTAANGSETETVYRINAFERKEIRMETHSNEHGKIVYLLEKR